MCGICGYLSFNSRWSQQDLYRMNEKIRRRGPDDEGYYHDGPIGLAMRRLSIIDLDSGQQPIFNEDRTIVVVFNGEIYNYRNLTQQLLELGHRFRTASDTEVLVHLYEEYGLDFVERLEGMFGFALWDTRKRRLVLGRDRLGIKPLFLAQSDEGILFASELKSIVDTGMHSATVSAAAVDQFLTYTFIPAPATIYDGIQKLLPGHIAVFDFDSRQAVQRRYWDIPNVAEEPRDESEWAELVERRLEAAVDSHMVSDVPVGAFLSGGIDSSLIVAMMARHSNKPIRTFTVGFTETDSAFIDERKYARMLANRYSLDHVELDVKPDFAAIAGDIVDAFDEPFADDSIIPSYYVSQLAGQSVKVAMTGLGGDELFAGYRRHLGLSLGEHYARLPRWLNDYAFAPLVRLLPDVPALADRIDHVKRFVRSAGKSAAARYQDSLATLRRDERNRLYAPEFSKRVADSGAEEVIEQPFEYFGRASHPLERALRTDLRVYLVDDILTLTDRLSMWHSLELRVPFLDHHLVETAARIPASLKIRRFEQKYLLRRVARKWLPDEILDHRKQGFEAPMGRWLRGPLREYFARALQDSAARNPNWFDYGRIDEIFREHVAGRQKNNRILFSLLMLHLWLERKRSVV